MRPQDESVDKTILRACPVNLRLTKKNPGVREPSDDLRTPVG